MTIDNPIDDLAFKYPDLITIKRMSKFEVLNIGGINIDACEKTSEHEKR